MIVATIAIAKGVFISVLPTWLDVNISINESVTRSLATSLTTLTVIFAMLLFGGISLRDFLYVLLLGVIIGTYSSIFIASQILVVWESRGFLIWRKKI